MCRLPRFPLYFSALSVLGGCVIFYGALQAHQTVFDGWDSFPHLLGLFGPSQTYLQVRVKFLIMKQFCTICRRLMLTTALLLLTFKKATSSWMALDRAADSSVLFKNCFVLFLTQCAWLGLYNLSDTKARIQVLLWHCVRGRKEKAVPYTSTAEDTRLVAREEGWEQFP